MSQKTNFLKNTLDLLEADPEVKSFIYQQILDFNPFVTPETLVMVIARDPKAAYEPEQDTHDFSDEATASDQNCKYRIAVILKDGDTSIECEAFENDIFDAIRLAKDRLVARLVEIQNEIESPQDRLNAIKEANDNKLVH
jgi:hypothetical protein